MNHQIIRKKQPRTTRLITVIKLIITLTNFILLLQWSFTFAEASSDLDTDVVSLLALKESTVKDPTTQLQSWSLDTVNAVCQDWEGVKCSNSTGTLRVVSLKLPNRSLQGPIPISTLGKLDALRLLNLKSNDLHGEIPSDMANLKQIRKLYLHFNNFEGSIPDSVVSSWPHLFRLDLSFNRFSGQIPPSLASLRHLETLNLQNNVFSGSIPSIVSPPVIDFNVANNQLSGSIPTSLWNFSAVSFAGNPGLCGHPVAIACPQKQPIHERETKSGLGAGAIAGIVMGSVVIIAGAVLCFLGFCRQDEGRHSREEDLYSIDKSERAKANLKPQGTPGIVFVDKSSHGKFDMEELLRASAEVLGKGSLGTAYKAMLSDGMQVVVVKRLKEAMIGGVDISVYAQRIARLANLQHPNLMPIKAYYFTAHEKLLILDYMPNGSLSSLLHGNMSKVPLAWEKRIEVANSVSKALAYLHSQDVVHGNIKACNVLMGGDNEHIKLADYGLVQMATTKINNHNKVFGYMAPEVLDVRRATLKGDVYSFGILLLELLTGRSPILSAMSPPNNHIRDLPSWVHSILGEDQDSGSSHLFDLEIMKFEHTLHEMMQLLQIALPCVSPSPDARPTMEEVCSQIQALCGSANDDLESIESI